jgi:hypothetical protein
VLDPDDRPVAKGTLCAQDHGFNLHGASRVAANDKPGRLTLCRRRARAQRAWGRGWVGRP